MEKVKIIMLLMAIWGVQGQVPTAPTPGQPPPTTTVSQESTIPTAPTGPGPEPPTTPAPTDEPTTTAPETTTTPVTTTTVPETTTTVPETTTTAPSATSPAPPPPQDCPSTGVHTFPTTHCQYFITCINGNEHNNRCQDGFLFDTNRGNCEPAGTVDCGDRTRP